MKPSIIKIALSLLFILLVSCKFIIAGSYSNSEFYRVPLSTKDFIQKFQELKEKHEAYKVFTVNKNGETIELKDTLEENLYSFWVNVGKDSTLLFVINSNINPNDTHTLVKLVSLSTHQHFGNWKEINTDDLTEEENKQIKQIFQKKIISNIH